MKKLHYDENHQLMEIEMRKSRQACKGSIEYKFEELQPYKDVALFVNGSCDIDYEIDNDDPDVGYFGGLEIYINRISIDGDGKDKPALNLDSASELYKLIEKRLLDDPYWINDEVYQDASSGPDPDRYRD